MSCSEIAILLWAKAQRLRLAISVVSKTAGDRRSQTGGMFASLTPAVFEHSAFHPIVVCPCKPPFIEWWNASVSKKSSYEKAEVRIPLRLGQKER
ncbi:hypothetical protein HYV84_03025 [Candidatus Woesearchaeota archaeon]|nr:hypothetical protein [Candidatus Woesearchaeota archaeon]